MRRETVVRRQRHRHQPEFAHHPLPAHVDMFRFATIEAVEEETIRSWHVSDARHAPNMVGGPSTDNVQRFRRQPRTTLRSGGMVAASPSRCSSTDTLVPGGCVPCETCASCSGSPSRMTLRAAVPMASASASETWPASSITSVSTLPSKFCRANSHAVPAKSRTSCPAPAAVRRLLVIRRLL